MKEFKEANLQTSREVTLVGGVIIDDQNVVQLDAKVSSSPDVATTYSENITNSNIYYENREESRRQISEFKKKIYELEDELVNEPAEELNNEPEDKPEDEIVGEPVEDITEK